MARGAATSWSATRSAPLRRRRQTSRDVAMTSTTRRHAGLRRRRDPRGLPDPGARALRQAARLSRQRGLGAEAAGRSIERMIDRPTRPNTPTCIAACIISPMPRPRLRGGARERARLPQRGVDRRDHLHPLGHRGDQPRRRRRFGPGHIGEGDEIVLSIMEHHSNIVPWHFLRERKGAVLKWVDVRRRGQLLARGSSSRR